MRKVVIFGARSRGAALLSMLTKVGTFEIIAIIDNNPSAKGLKLAKKFKIMTKTNMEGIDFQDIDIIFETTGDEQLLNELKSICSEHIVIIPKQELHQMMQMFGKMMKGKRRQSAREEKRTFDAIIAHSEEMKVAVQQAKLAATTDVGILLRGETGTGKGLFARAIHFTSSRHNKPFIQVQCESDSESLLEVELFGYESEKEKKKGLFEKANGGTLFFDELTNLSASMQEKLLKVFKEKAIRRIGGRKDIPVDVRMIAATDVYLERVIIEQTFIEELYYQFNKISITLPPLRERSEDIQSLSMHIINKLNKRHQREVEQIEDSALNMLKSYDWPGNVSELENMIVRAMIYMDRQDRIIEAKHLPELLHLQHSDRANSEQIEGETLQEKLEYYEKRIIAQSLEENQWNKTLTAKKLGLSVRNLYYKLEKYKI